MEVWADVYAATGKQQHLELMNRYTRHRLFEPHLCGEDILTICMPFIHCQIVEPYENFSCGFFGVCAPSQGENG